MSHKASVVGRKLRKRGGDHTTEQTELEEKVPG
jgi:hypothetical protein